MGIKQFDVAEWDVSFNGQRAHMFNRSWNVSIQRNYEEKDNGTVLECCYLFVEDTYPFEKLKTNKFTFCLPLIFSVEKDVNNFWKKNNKIFDLRTYEYLNEIENEELKDEIRKSLNSLPHHYFSDRWKVSDIDSHGVQYEDSEKIYKDWKPYNVVFSNRVLDTNPDHFVVDVGIIFTNEIFDIHVVIRGELLEGRIEKQDVALNKIDYLTRENKLYWNKYCFITITNKNTKEVKKYSYLKQRYCDQDERPMFS